MIENNGLSLDDIKSQINEIIADIKTNLNPLEKEEDTNTQNNEIALTSDYNIILKQLKYYIKLLIEEKNINNNVMYNRKNYKQLESYITKLEDDIRFLMKREFQNKIHRDSLEMKIRAYIQVEEEYESLKEKVKFEDGKFLDNDRKDNEIIILRRENSNLKKEINKLEEEKKEALIQQEHMKELETKYINGEEIIKGLKFKVRQLTNKVNELEEEKRNNTINNNNTFNEIKSKNNEKNLVINDSNYNSRNKIDFIKINNDGKFSLEKFSFNKNNINLKHVTNYKLPTNIANYESTKNTNTNSMKTIDNNKLIVSTYNKIYNKINKNIIIPVRNDLYKKTKKIKSSSVPMKDDNDKSEMLNKYLSGSKTNSTNSKYGTLIRNKSLNRINNNLPGYLVMSNSTIGGKYKNRELHNHYEYSGLNIVAINKKNK
jgi:hypothetical protein